MVTRNLAAPSVAWNGDPADFELERSPFYWLSRAYGAYERAMTEALRRSGVGAPAWRILLILSEFEPASVGTLAECAVTQHSTMVKAVQRMTAAGLVVAAPSATDGRVTHVRLTDAGRAKLGDVLRAAATIQARALAGRGGDTPSGLSERLRDIATRLEP